MAKSISDYLKENGEMRERFIDRAFEEDPNLATLDEFSDALAKAFNTSRGQRVLDKLDAKEFQILWESSELNSRADFISNRTDRGLPTDTDEEAEHDYEISRDVAKGEKTKPSDIIVTPINKAYETPTYERNGKRIHGYRRGYKRWSVNELEFLKQREIAGVQKVQTINEFRQHFKGSQRSETSIRNKLYRI